MRVVELRDAGANDAGTRKRPLEWRCENTSEAAPGAFACMIVLHTGRGLAAASGGASEERRPWHAKI
nr:MAG TPA: hypothetical protein [Caudoviricetes sp.]